MDCSSCREQVDLYILGALDTSEAKAVEQHLASCSDCRDEYARTRELVAVFTAPVLEEADHRSGRARLRERLNAEIGVARRRESFTRRVAACAKAAPFAAAAALFVFMLRSPRPAEDRHGEASPRWRHQGVSLCSGEDATYPLVRGDVVLAFEEKGGNRHVVALSRGTGAVSWRSPFTVTGCALASDRQRAYAWTPAEDGSSELVALDLATGRVVWRHAPEGSGAERSHLVTLSDGLCWTEDGLLTVLAARTGCPKWARRLGEAGDLSVSAGPGGVLYVASKSAISAVRADDGTVEWQVAAASIPGRSMPPLLRVDADTLVVAQRRLGGRGVLRCHEASSGHLRWQRHLRLPVHSLTLAGDVYVRSTDVHAFDGATGRRCWSAPVGGCSPVVAAAGQLYAVEGRDSPVILALDPATGARAWQQSLVSSCSGLVVVGGTGYLSARDGALYALAVRRSPPLALPDHARPRPVFRAAANQGRPRPSA